MEPGEKLTIDDVVTVLRTWTANRMHGKVTVHVQDAVSSGSPSRLVRAKLVPGVLPKRATLQRLSAAAASAGREATLSVVSGPSVLGGEALTVMPVIACQDSGLIGLGSPSDDPPRQTSPRGVAGVREGAV